MQHIAASEVKQRLGQHMESALTQPVMIEKPDRPAIVMSSVAEHERLQADGRCLQELEGSLAGIDETMRRLQERIECLKLT